MTDSEEIRSREGYATRTAELYARAFDWADEKAIEASLSVNGAYNAQIAALARMQAALGVSRTMGRHALLRLLHFADQNRMTQFEIANEMQVTSSNVTFLVDGLEKDGMVQRLPHPTDRRTVHVQLTPEGEAIAAVIVPSMARFMGRMLAGFSDADKEQLSSLLDRMRRNAEQFDAKALD
jgi:DNA-binding MarR family transcriptional regulator